MKIVVLGGGYAGLACANSLSHTYPGYHIELVDQHPRFNHRIRQHEVLTGAAPDNIDYLAHSRKHGYEFVQARVEAIDTHNREVLVYCTDRLRTLHYDYLVYALGSHTKAVDKSAAIEAIWHLDSDAQVADAAASLSRAARSERQLLVVGGGLTAVEYATEIASSLPAIRVTVATANQLLPGYARATRAHVARFMDQRGIVLREHTPITAFQPGLARTPEGSLRYDYCVLAGGMEAVTLPGLNYLPNGQIAVNAALQARECERIFVLGDAAGARYPDARPVRASCATAMSMVPTVVKNLGLAGAGEPLTPFAPFHLLHCISLGREDAVMQFVTPDDQVTDTVITGAEAVAVKAQIIRAVFATLDWDHRSPLADDWPDFGALMEKYCVVNE